MIVPFPTDALPLHERRVGGLLAGAITSPCAKTNCYPKG